MIVVSPTWLISQRCGGGSKAGQSGGDFAVWQTKNLAHGNGGQRAGQVVASPDRDVERLADRP